MGQPAAKQGDQITATDIHLIQPPGTAPPVPVPHPFSGIIDGELSSDVNIESRPAATVNSGTGTTNVLAPPSALYQPPTNTGIDITNATGAFTTGTGSLIVTIYYAVITLG